MRLHFFFIAASLFTTFHLNAQDPGASPSSSLSKGSHQIGASLREMTSNKAYGLQAHLRYGYFLFDRFQVGVNANTGARDFNIFYASGGPLVKYHIKDGWFSPFALTYADFGYCSFNDERPQYYEKGYLTWNKYFIGAGLGFYGLNDHWGFEAFMGYQQEYYNRFDDNRPESEIDQWSTPIHWLISYSF